eukprot:11886907-Heterocapsa_arctica.AAC.1
MRRYICRTHLGALGAWRHGARTRLTELMVRRLEGPPIVEIDYSFMRTADPEDRLATVLLALRKQKGYGFAVVAKCKGSTDTFAVAALVKWLGEA